MKKKVTQSRKQTLHLDAADHIAAGASDNSSTTGASIDHDLAQPVWKYFGEDQGDAQGSARGFGTCTEAQGNR